MSPLQLALHGDQIRNARKDLELDLWDSPLTINCLVRNMRGGSQSKLVQTEDGCYYVAKFWGNPQHPRTMMNELIVHQLVSRLNVLVPKLCFLRLPEHFQDLHQIYFLRGNTRTRPVGTLHLGSRLPADPNRKAIFDILPASHYDKISNLGDFAVMFVLDRWLHQTDKRQAVYVPDRTNGNLRFSAYFIDNGAAFDGQYWVLGDSPHQGLAWDRKIYSKLDMRALVKDAIGRVQAISESELLATSEIIPPAWLEAGDREQLGVLLGQLVIRQEKLPSLVDRHLNALGL